MDVGSCQALADKGHSLLFSDGAQGVSSPHLASKASVATPPMKTSLSNNPRDQLERHVHPSAVSLPLLPQSIAIPRTQDLAQVQNPCLWKNNATDGICRSCGNLGMCWHSQADYFTTQLAKTNLQEASITHLIHAHV